ncbi:RHS repeat domain-containing protein, partial [Glaciecola siphonariae]
EYLYNEYGALTTVNAMHGNTTYFSSHIELDDIGNVYEKSSSYYDGNGGTQAFVETFEYTDDLNRLNKRTLAMTQGALANSFTQNFDYEYDAAGNIKHKSDKGHYKYTHDDPSKTDLPNQLVSIHSDASLSEASKLLSFAYDDNGNTLADGERTFTYTPFNKPSRITKGGNVVNITYGIDRQILRKTHKRMENGQLVITTHTYIDGYERIEKSTGNQITEHKFTEANGNVVFTFRQSTTSQSISNRRDEHYIIKDVQGSVAMVTDWDASVVSQYLYTPFGEQIQLLQSSVLDGIAYQPTTERGYTGHHEMGSVGITHMNGRIYDPTLGRFFQADPFIQGPTNSQSYNRYSYVLNNPLSYTDPSGYLWNNITKPFKKLGRSIIRGASKIFGAELVNFIGSAVATYFGGAWGAAAWSYEFTRAMGGTSSGALRGAFTAYVSSYVNANENFSWYEKVAINTAVEAGARAMSSDTHQQSTGDIFARSNSKDLASDDLKDYAFQYRQYIAELNPRTLMGRIQIATHAKVLGFRKTHSHAGALVRSRKHAEFERKQMVNALSVDVVLSVHLTSIAIVTGASSVPQDAKSAAIPLGGGMDNKHGKLVGAFGHVNSLIDFYNRSQVYSKFFDKNPRFEDRLRMLELSATDYYINNCQKEIQCF